MPLAVQCNLEEVALFDVGHFQRRELKVSMEKHGKHVSNQSLKLGELNPKPAGVPRVEGERTRVEG